MEPHLAHRRRHPPDAGSYGPLLFIAVSKLLKSVVMLGVAVGALHFIHRDVHGTALRWARQLHVDPGHRLVRNAMAHTTRLTDKRLRELSVVAVLYAAVFGTEGIGLLCRRRWAEWLTVVSTAGLLPFEVFELTRRFTAVRLGVLVLNAVIVVYLIVRLWRGREGAKAADAEAGPAT